MAQPSVRNLARSSSFAGLAEIWRVLSGLFLTPVILLHIGIEGYGIWALIFGLAGSLNVIGVGFGSAYAKFTAEYDARGDYRDLNELLGSGVALVSTAAVAALVPLWFVREPLLRVAGVPEASLLMAGQALILVGATVGMIMSLGCVRQILAGLQRTDLRYKSMILASTLYFALGIGLVSQGYGLVGLAAAYFAGEACSIVLAWWWCRRLRPEIRLSPLGATRGGLRRAAALGGRFQLLFLLSFSSRQGFKVLLSALLGPATLGVFEIGHKIVRLAETGAASLHAPMMPAFASLHSEGDRDRTRAGVEIGARALFLVALLSFGFVAVFADRAIEVWTGQTFPLAAWTIRALAAAYVFKQLSAAGTASLRGRGTFRLEFQMSLLQLGLRAALVAPLYLAWGFKGFVMAEPIAIVPATIFFLWSFGKLEAFSGWDYALRVMARPIAVLVPLIAGLALAATQVDLAIPGLVPGLAGRPAIAAELMTWGLAYGALALAAIWTLILSAEERKAISSRLTKLLPAR